MSTSVSSPEATGLAGTFDKPELVFGLVAPVGIDLDRIGADLQSILADAGYRGIFLHLSQLLVEQAGTEHEEVPEDEYDRISSRMTQGNEFREKNSLDAVAILAIAAIRRYRTLLTGSTTPGRIAYILRSLKRPEEVQLLRSVYGPRFRVIAVTAPRAWRIRSLALQIAHSRGESDLVRYLKSAEELALRDEDETQVGFGQRLRDTFPLADLFLDATNPTRLESDLRRFLEIIFGHPFHTPTVDEYLMFHAWAASLRSADPSRQVGAVIGTKDGQILAAGTNEVPKAGGGLYWPSPCEGEDHRDWKRGESASHESRSQLVRECLHRLLQAGLLTENTAGIDDELVRKALAALEHSAVMNIGEYGRAVHAEMAALSDAARRGVAVEGNRLYCTTYPCHVCARHLVAAGLSEVVYIEPYPKSRAVELHGDAIADPAAASSVPPRDRLVFRPHTGVAPRYYPSAFTARKRMERKHPPRIAHWSWSAARPTLEGLDARLPLAYLELEKSVLERNHFFEERGGHGGRT